MIETEKTNLTVRLETDYYEYLKLLSYDLSAREGKRIGLSEIVRRALVKSFPLEKSSRLTS
jgi:hypothetical protein